MAEKTSMTLQGFLKPITTEIIEERVISDRFVDDNGNPIPFRVRAIPQEVNDQLINKYTVTVKGKNGQHEKLNKTAYQSALVVACCVQPDFNAKDLCDAYGVVNPITLPGKMLFAGEFAQLTSFIMEVNNFAGPEELEDEAKNS